MLQLQLHLYMYIYYDGEQYYYINKAGYNFVNENVDIPFNYDKRDVYIGSNIVHVGCKSN